MHLGAGRVLPPALTLDELTEDLTGYLAHLPAADIAAAARGLTRMAFHARACCQVRQLGRRSDCSKP